MDTGRFDAWTRRRFGLGVSGLAAGMLSVAGGGHVVARKKKKKKGSSNPCSGKNYCVDQSHTCGADGRGRCYVQAFGGNVCGGVTYSQASCATCGAGTVCVLGTGTGVCDYAFGDYLCTEPYM